MEIKKIFTGKVQKRPMEKKPREGVKQGKVVMAPEAAKLNDKERTELVDKMFQEAYEGFGKLNQTLSIAVDTSTLSKIDDSIPTGWTRSPHMRACLRSGARLNGVLQKLSKEINTEETKQVDQQSIEKLKELLEALAA